MTAAHIKVRDRPMWRRFVTGLVFLAFLAGCASDPGYRLAKEDPGALPQDLDAFLRNWAEETLPSVDDQTIVRANRPVRTVSDDITTEGGSGWAIWHVCLVVEKLRSEDSDGWIRSYELAIREGRVVTRRYYLSDVMGC